VIARSCLSSVVVAGLFAAGPAMPAPDRAAAPHLSSPNLARHHYSVSARVRPLLVFWISVPDIGDAVVTTRHGADSRGYTLLIGSDPDRTPRHVNRWGYIDEDIHGTAAQLVGLMTESDEQSVEQAQASLRQGAVDRKYQVIRATVDGDQIRSVVTAIDVPAAYSYRQVRSVLDLASQRQDGETRVVHLPSGAHPGFLSALADLIHQQVQTFRTSGIVSRGVPMTYVHHGRLYQLRATRADVVSKVHVGSAAYQQVLSADFEIRNGYTGELTLFSMTFGTEGAVAEVPLTASYQPRWWMQVELALDDLKPYD
jgi:hypothetical protein